MELIAILQLIVSVILAFALFAVSGAAWRNAEYLSRIRDGLGEINDRLVDMTRVVAGIADVAKAVDDKYVKPGTDREERDDPQNTLHSREHIEEIGARLAAGESAETLSSEYEYSLSMIEAIGNTYAMQRERLPKAGAS